ncbi:MAG: DUF262 domain-containing protein [Nitrososphaerota archaeon]|nr:DUF262 domain-containing protein [Nitrososphaerota archaeon]
MSDPNPLRSLITPQDQTLRKVFNAQRSYFIDIYQREYKWTDENVKTLLNDIEVQFLQNGRTKTDPKEIRQDVLQHFEPYFLNTYLTHTTDATTSIVDGQQRLTTLLLVFIKLYLILKKVEKDSINDQKTFAAKVLEQLIFETNDFGEPKRFKIFNENREDAFRALIEGREFKPLEETSNRIIQNFHVISDYLDNFLDTGTGGGYDLAKLTYYLTYMLDLVSIVEIRIERQNNVAMIFEVVNDRGLGLKPYEILKGKLIGGLSPQLKEQANRVWTELQEKYYATKLRNSTEKIVDLDMFFRAFFRAKFADTESDYEKFEGDYHYELYRNPKIRKFFGEFKDPNLLFRWITLDFRYFADLYLRLRTTYEYEYLIFNKLLDQNQQYLLLLSSITRDDPSENVKISAIAQKFDQVHVILRLLGAYDSNEFQRLIYRLNVAIRDKNIPNALREFDDILIKVLEDAGAIIAGQHKEVAELFEYERFKEMSNKWANFSKYVLMRIDRYLAKHLDKPSYASADLEELEDRFNRSGAKRYAMHLEHIYTQHPENKILFKKGEVFDESTFQRTRNLLGMVLLLKDKQNLSSNDETYKDKIDTYSKSNLIWNELLVGHMPGIDVRNLPLELQFQKIQPTAEGVFPRESVEERQKTVFAAIKCIWGSVPADKETGQSST